MSEWSPASGQVVPGLLCSPGTCQVDGCVFTSQGLVKISGVVMILNAALFPLFVQTTLTLLSNLLEYIQALSHLSLVSA